MLIPFILSVIAWPIFTFLSIVLISKFLMPLFNITNKPEMGWFPDINYKQADIFQAVTLIVSQVIVVLVAQSIYSLFHHQATPWLAIPFALWCFVFGPFSWQINHYLEMKYEGLSPSSFEKHLGGSWTIGLGIGWAIGTILLLKITPSVIILEAIAIQIGAFFILWILLQWICKNHPKWRNSAGFIVALWSSYSAAFVFDMLTQVEIGGLQFDNVVLAVCTWTAISIVCYILASHVALSVRVLYIPYLINAGIALLATCINWYHIFVTLPLLVIALIISGCKIQTIKKGIMITRIQDYYLEQSIDEAKDLKEFTGEQYNLMEVAGAPRMLIDEKIYSGTDVLFAGFHWDTTIGATEGKIYKIALQTVSMEKDEINYIFNHTLKYLITQMGKYSQHHFLSKKYVWNTDDGNVWFDKVSKIGWHGVNLILTSSFIRGQWKD
jgi:hypothetical protein